MLERVLGRSVPTHVAAVIVLATATLGTALALDYSSLSAERVTTASSLLAPTDFVVSGVQTDFKGYNRIDVTFVLSNSDGAAEHAANGSLQLVDRGGNLLVSKSFDERVPAGASSSVKVVFGKRDVVRNYAETLFVIRQRG